MGNFLCRKVSTGVGLLVIISISVLLGWVMVKSYMDFMNEHFDPIQYEFTEAGEN